MSTKASSKPLSRAAIFATNDVKTEVVNVPEWGGSVTVQGMTGAARDRWEQMLVKAGETSTENARAKLVIVSVIDENGDPLFTEDDIIALGKKSGNALTRISNVAQRLSRLGQSDLDDAVKN